MTLNTIKVKDFQSIKYAEIELGKFTTFTGPSSSGKSSTMRAARALVRNDFVPSQVRQGAKESHITITFGDNAVTAIRGKSKSTYKLNSDEFTKAGRSVPEPIAELIQMEEIADIDSTFSSQFDKPYLISDSGSVAAKVLGTLTNVSVLHNGIREANRRRLEVNAKSKVRTADLEKTVTELEQFEGLDEAMSSLNDAQETLTRIEEVGKQVKEIQNVVGRLENLYRDSIQAEAGLVDLKPAEETVQKFSALQDVGSLSKALERIEALESSQPQWEYFNVPELPQEWESLLESLKSITAKTSRIKELASDMPRWKYQEVPQDLGDLEDNLPNLVRLDKEILLKLKNLTEEYREDLKTLEETKKRIKELETEYGTLLEGYDSCPLCGTTIPH